VGENSSSSACSFQISAEQDRGLTPKTAVQLVASLRNDFERFDNEAKAFSAKWLADVTFEEKRRRKAKVVADDLTLDERLHTTEGRFRVGVYLHTVDTCLNQLKRRFESLELVYTVFKYFVCTSTHRDNIEGEERGRGAWGPTQMSEQVPPVALLRHCLMLQQLHFSRSFNASSWRMIWILNGRYPSGRFY